MESSATLGPSPEQDAEASKLSQEAAERIANLAAAELAAAAPATATEPSPAIKIDREDLLEYKLLGSRADYTQLQVTMYTRELQRSQAEANQVAFDASELLQKLGGKYGIDMRANKITEDGYLVPRVPPVRR